MKRVSLLAAALAVSALLVGSGWAAGASSAGVVGNWRVYSSRLDYDAGGGSVSQPLSSRVLKLRRNRTWQFGSSKGRFSVSRATAADWKRWQADPYGPRSKITLKGWARQTATGPIEESSRVDFIWVVYRVKPPTVSRSGWVHTKFGRVRP